MSETFTMDDVNRLGERRVCDMGDVNERDRVNPAYACIVRTVPT